MLEPEQAVPEVGSGSSGDVGIRPRWGLSDAAVGFVVAFVLSNIAVGVWLGARGLAEVDLGAMAVGQLGLWGGLLGAPLLASRRKGAGSLRHDFGFGFELRDLRWLSVGVACQIIAVPILYLLLQQLTGDLDVGAAARELTDRAHGPAFLVLGLLLTFAAPVIEELFYRGLLLRAAERRWGTRTAVIVSSGVFAGSHFQLVQFPALFGFAVVLAVLTVRAGRLGPAIAAHVAFNGVTVVALALAR